MNGVVDSGFVDDLSGKLMSLERSGTGRRGRETGGPAEEAAIVSFG